MALARVQQASNAGFSATTLTVTMGSVPTPNNLLVASMFTRGTAATNPSGFTTAVEIVNSTEDDRLRIAYKIAGSSEANPQWTGLDTGDGSGTAAAVYEYSGNLTASPLDQTASTGRIASTNTIDSGTTGTLSHTDEVCIAACGHRAPINTVAMSNSYTLQTDIIDSAPTALCGLLAGDRIVSATTAQATTFTWVNADLVIAAIATFEASATVVTMKRSKSRKISRQGGLVMGLNLMEWF